MNILLKRNDKGYTFTYTIVDENDVVIDLTGAVVTFNMGDRNSVVSSKPATIVDAVNGVVSYTFAEDDTLIEGNFIAEFSVNKSNNIITYPRNNYLIVNIMGNVDTNNANITLDLIAAKAGDFESKLNSILRQTGNVNMSAMNDYTWAATAGQLTYTMPVGSNYDVNSKWFEVQVGGIPVDPNLVIRNTSNQFTLLVDSSLIKAGMIVRAKWTEPIVPVISGPTVISQQPTEPINAPEGTVWLDTSDNSFQGTVFQELEDKINNISVSVLDYGAKGDNVTDDSDAIIAAEALVIALGGNARLLVPNGTYKITKPIKIRCNLDAEQATFNYTGTGTALVIGDDSSSGIVTYRKLFKLPRVIKTGRVTGWDGSSIGVKAVNLNGCHVFISFIQDFEKGLVIYGYGQGNAYNNYFLGTLWENHKNLVLEGDATSWVNQNQFFGGRLQQSLSKGAILDDVNAAQIDMSSTIQPNTNTFVGTSIEGENIAYYRADISGRYNVFYNCRWEGQNGALPRVRYRSTSYSNKIDGGYDSSKIVETFDAGALGGEIRDNAGAYVFATATTGQSIPNNVVTAINTWGAIVSRRIDYNATTGEFTPRAGRWKISATVCFAPNATGRRIAHIVCNGSTRDIFEAPGNAGRGSLKVEDVYAFNGSQTFKITCMQTSGGNLALETTSGYVKLQAEYLGY